MIEKYLLENTLQLKRWRRFKKNRISIFCIWPLLLTILFSLTAEFWANSKPLYLYKNGKNYFPVLFDYKATELGEEDLLLVDYKEMQLTQNDWAIWPPIRWDPFESNNDVDYFPSPPSLRNLMGTDDRGRDVFVRLLYGMRYSLAYALLVWILTFVIGTFLGGIMGYFGGKIDFFGQRAIEIFSSIPQFFILLIVISIFQPGLMWLVLISSLFGWITISYYVRGEFLKNRRKEYVDAARAMGASWPRILFVHILPNSLSPLITFSPFVIAGGIMGLASLDYLGFGLMPPTPSWGELLSQAQKNFTTAWWLAVFPSAFLFFTLVSLTMIGDGVRDAMDPNL